VAAGFILNYVGYQVPFFIACGFALVTFAVTHKLDPEAQRSAGRIAADDARLAAGAFTAADDADLSAEIIAAQASAMLLATDGGAGEEIAGQAAAHSIYGATRSP
jgi:hypothetical protein